MDEGMLEIVQKILYFVTYIAIGGTFCMLFFFIFAPSILGSRAISKQLVALDERIEQLGATLNQLAQSIEGLSDKSKNNSR
jgi:hypothetical protein